MNASLIALSTPAELSELWNVPLMATQMVLATFCFTVSMVSIILIRYKTDETLWKMNFHLRVTQTWLLALHVFGFLYVFLCLNVTQYPLLPAFLNALLNTIYCGLWCSMISQLYVRAVQMSNNPFNDKPPTSPCMQNLLIMVNYFVCCGSILSVEMLQIFGVVSNPDYQIVSAVFVAALSALLIVLMYRKMTAARVAVAFNIPPTFNRYSEALGKLYYEVPTMLVFVSLPYILEIFCRLIPDCDYRYEVAVAQLFFTNLSPAYSVVLISINPCYKQAFVRGFFGIVTCFRNKKVTALPRNVRY